MKTHITLTLYSKAKNPKQILIPIADIQSAKSVNNKYTEIMLDHGETKQREMLRVIETPEAIEKKILKS